MAEAAWATARTRDPARCPVPPPGPPVRPGQREESRRRRAHTLICIAWAVLSRGSDYAEAGEDYYEQRDRRNREHLIRHHQQALARLGYQVTLIPPGDGPRRPAQAA